jgi:hypothetical protein
LSAVVVRSSAFVATLKPGISCLLASEFLTLGHLAQSRCADCDGLENKAAAATARMATPPGRSSLADMSISPNIRPFQTAGIRYWQITPAFVDAAMSYAALDRCALLMLRRS